MWVSGSGPNRVRRDGHIDVPSVVEYDECRMGVAHRLVVECGRETGVPEWCAGARGTGWAISRASADGSVGHRLRASVVARFAGWW